MSGRHDNRSMDPEGSGNPPSDRRASCRYVVGEIPAAFGWQETPGTIQAPARESGSPTAPSKGVAESSAPDPGGLIGGITSRGSVFARGTPSSNGNAQQRHPARTASTAGPLRRSARVSTARPLHRSGKVLTAGPLRRSAKVSTPRPLRPLAKPSTQQGRFARSSSSPTAKPSASLPEELPATANSFPVPSGGGASPPATANSGAGQTPETGTEPFQMRSCGALVLDVSYTGISLVSEATPRGGQTVFVRLERPQPSAWVEGVVRSIATRERIDDLLVRLAFREPCPYEFFKTAVYGQPK